MKHFNEQQQKVNESVNKHINKVINKQIYNNDKVAYHPPTQEQFQFMKSNQQNLFSPINEEEINQIIENRIKKLTQPKITILIIIIVVLSLLNVLFIFILIKSKNINIKYNKKEINS